MNFDKENHLYNGGEYQSVSKWLQKFKKPFNAPKIAQIMASKEGIDPQEILDKWNLKGSMAINYGNAIHEAVEYWIRYNEIVDNEHQKLAVEELSKILDREKLNSEIIVKSDTLKVAGTIDIVESLGNKEINIWDIKTNAELEGKSYNNLNSPLDHLPQTKLNEYRLQQSMYKYLAEESGIKVKEINLLHWNGSKYKKIKLEPIDIKKLVG